MKYNGPYSLTQEEKENIISLINKQEYEDLFFYIEYLMEEL